MASGNRYNATSTINHWIVALLVTVMMALGYMAAAAPNEAAEGYIMSVHISLGFFLFFLALWRICYRVVRGFPPLQETAKWQRWTAYVVHRLILIALAAQIFSGPLYLFTENAGVTVFNWFTIMIPLKSLAFLHAPMETVHIYTGLYLLPALLALHLIGAVHHIFQSKRDNPAEL